MELNLSQRRKGLEAKIPDIRRTVGVVEYLLSRQKGSSPAEDDDELNEDEDEDDEDDNQKPIKTLFELNDTLFAEAEVEETGTVNLWLGVRALRPDRPALALTRSSPDMRYSSDRRPMSCSRTRSLRLWNS